MKTETSGNEILDVVVRIVVEALRVDEERVIPEARIFTDLDAESLDLLDIRFRIENDFGFKIAQGEIINYLGEELPRSEIEERLTVASIVDYITDRIKQGPAQ